MAIRGARVDERRITPHLLVRNASEAIEFYQRAFGAVEVYRSKLPHTTGIHAKIRINESVIMLTDETPPDEQGLGHFEVKLGSPQTLCGTSVVLELFFADVDKAYQRAVDAGAKATLPLGDAFWGDRYGWVTDPFGHIWGMAQVLEEVSPEEVQRRMAESMQTT